MCIDCFQKIALLARSGSVSKCSTTLVILDWDLILTLILKILMLRS